MKQKQPIVCFLLCVVLLSCFSVPSFATDLATVPTAPTATDFYTQEGASIRTSAPYGIRFTVNVSSVYKATLDSLQNSGYEITYGALIAPTQWVETAGAFTKEALGNGNYVDSATRTFAWATENKNDVWQYRVALVNLPHSWSALSHSLSGIGYITLTKGDESITYYTPYNAAQHARTVGEVARDAYEAGLRADAITTVLNMGTSYFHTNNATAKTINSSPNTEQDIFEGVSEISYAAYLAKVSASGYTLYTSNTLGNNVYSTHMKGNEIMTVMWIPNESELRVMRESTATTSLPALSAGDYTVLYDSTLLLQVGLNEQQGIYAGMCYVMRLHDGSFVVIDGGYSNSVGANQTDSGNAEQLYSVLEHLAPDPQSITVAAWIFTHGHYDHLGAFVRFSELYADDVTVEQFIYNRPTADVCSNLGSGDEARWNAAEAAIKSKYATANTVTAHPGQVLPVRNAKITMLYTHDLHAICQNVSDYNDALYNATADDGIEDSATVYDYAQYNNTGLIFTLEADGVKTLFPADACMDTGAILLALYDENVLKADIMQVAHHGIQQTACNIYTTVAPTYALWPLGTGDISMPDLVNDRFDFVKCVSATWREGMNSYFFENGMLKSTVYLANDDIHVLTLKNGAVTHQKFEDRKTFLQSEAYVSAYGNIYVPAPQEWFS